MLRERGGPALTGPGTGEGSGVWAAQLWCLGSHSLSLCLSGVYPFILLFLLHLRLPFRCSVCSFSISAALRP